MWSRMASKRLKVEEIAENTASQATLEQLKGVGVAMSDRLLKARAERPFTDWDDVMRRVPGIGDRNARRLSQQGLRVGGRPYAGDTPAGDHFDRSGLIDQIIQFSQA